MVLIKEFDDRLKAKGLSSYIVECNDIFVDVFKDENGNYFVSSLDDYKYASRFAENANFMKLSRGVDFANEIYHYDRIIAPSKNVVKDLLTQ